MGGFEDYAFIALLALLLFGPKKLPVLARQLGKLMGDFRRASNEFRAQMEEELRIAEQADRQKQVAAIEAAAPASPPAELPAETTSHSSSPYESSAEADAVSEPEGGYMQDVPTEFSAEGTPGAAAEPAPAPAPIATSGDLSIMPPSTGLPTPKSAPPAVADIAQAPESELETETLHG